MNPQSWQEDQVLGDRVSRNLQKEEENNSRFSKRASRLLKKYFKKQKWPMDLSDKDAVLDAASLIGDLKRAYFQTFKKKLKP